MTSQYAKYVKPRYDNDPEYREKLRKYNTTARMKQYYENEEVREQRKKYNTIYQKQRYQNDPEYRVKISLYMKERYAKKKDALKSPNSQNI